MNMPDWTPDEIIKARDHRQAFTQLDKWAQKMRNFDSTPIEKWTPDLALFFIKSLDQAKPTLRSGRVKQGTIDRWYWATKRQVLLASQKLDRHFNFTEAEKATWRVTLEQLEIARKTEQTESEPEPAKIIPWSTLNGISLLLLSDTARGTRRKWLKCMRGLLLSWTHSLAACLRSGDALRIFWRDLEVRRDEKGEYVRAVLSIMKTLRVHKQQPIKKLRERPDTPSLCPVLWFKMLKADFAHLYEGGKKQLGTDPISHRLVSTTSLTDGWRLMAKKMGLPADKVRAIQGHSGRMLSTAVSKSKLLDLPDHVQRRIGDWKPGSLSSDRYSRSTIDTEVDVKMSSVALCDYDRYLK